MFIRGMRVEATLPHFQTAWLFYHHALASFSLRDYGTALASIDKAIGAEPDNLRDHNLRIAVLRKLGRHEDVVACASEILRMDATSKTTLALQAEAHQRLGQDQRADEAYKKLLRLAYGDNAAIDALTSKDTRYHVNHVQKRQTPYMDYPIHVQFETYAQCNAACTFCVYPDLARKGAMMPMSLIDKIIGDLEQVPRHVRFQLSPFGVNEPFLDKRIFDILDKIRDRLPHAEITLTSNASPITEATLKRLSGYKLAYLWLSVVDYRKEVYEAKMKLSYDRLLSRLDMIHRAKTEGWFPHPVNLSRLKDNSEHDALYAAFMKARYPLFEQTLWPYANWLGGTSNEMTSEIADIPCSHWFELRIDAQRHRSTLLHGRPVEVSVGRCNQGLGLGDLQSGRLPALAARCI